VILQACPDANTVSSPQVRVAELQGFFERLGIVSGFFDREEWLLFDARSEVDWHASRRHDGQAPGVWISVGRELRKPLSLPLSEQR
jgi:hypothetical protein